MAQRCVGFPRIGCAPSPDLLTVSYSSCSRTGVTAAFGSGAFSRSGERVIDVGCGCGAIAIELSRRVAPGEILGVDISEPMLTRARERAMSDRAVRFILGDAATLDLAQARADLIVSRFGVMFFANPTLAFTKMLSGLRPGGRLAFACWREVGRNPWGARARRRQTCPDATGKSSGRAGPLRLGGPRTHRADPG